jgi:hypothetical protein
LDVVTGMTCESPREQFHSYPRKSLPSGKGGFTSGGFCSGGVLISRHQHDCAHEIDTGAMPFSKRMHYQHLTTTEGDSMYGESSQRGVSPDFVAVRKLPHLGFKSG